MKLKIKLALVFVMLYVYTCNAQQQATIDSIKQLKDTLFGMPPPPMNPPTSVSEDTFSSTETQAEFPGGQNGWLKFLQKNLQYNVPSKNKAPAGIYKVCVKFIVGIDGSISDIRLANDPGYGTADEVLRVILKSPKWIPGKHNVKAVRSLRSQNISFQVEEK